MKEVISSIQPFVLNQQVYIFEGTEIIDQFSARLMDLPENLIAYCYGNNITKISLKGDSHFVAKIKQDTEKREMTQYGESKLQINSI